MFYSQFILAKKGPLGTIWIAAHLERKLRKNQVADTDIGVSVDSILFPEVPIALRLSSHLLLGVVRIYSKKVNYLFDDCSDALLKVKQAFRSTAVDLPPEQSKAPYHSITLPETFDLDDFELPDNEAFQGNFVDHHVSSREQITLQDTMDGVSFSTSQFGPDERFGDGDASQIGLDLDEELFMDKGDGAGTSEMFVDTDVGPHASTREASPSKVNDYNEGISDPPLAAGTNHFVIQAPSTPGLTEEPNLPSTKEEIQVSDDHMDEDPNPCEVAAKEVSGTASCPVGPSDCVGAESLDGNVHYTEELNDEKVKTLKTESIEFISSEIAQPATSNEHIDGTNGQDSVGDFCNPSALDNEISADMQSDRCCGDAEININGTVQPVAENVIVMEVEDAGCNKTELNGTRHLLVDSGAEIDKSSVGLPLSGTVDAVTSGSELNHSFQTFLNLNNVEISESNIDEKSSDVATPILKACTSKGPVACEGVNQLVGTPSLPAQDDGPSSIEMSGQEDATNVIEMTANVGDLVEPTSKADKAYGVTFAADSTLVEPTSKVDQATNGVTFATDKNLVEPTLKADQAVTFAAESNLVEPTSKANQAAYGVDFAADSNLEEPTSKVDQAAYGVNFAADSNVVEPTSKADQADYGVTFPADSNSGGQLDNIVAEENHLEKENESDFPPPEVLLSMPNLPADLSDNFLVDSTPGKEVLATNGEAIDENAISGRKRSFTESTLTVQSVNSVESPSGAQSKGTGESIPDDNDLLSSILAGKRSTTFKMKPTPPVSDTVHPKRQRTAVRSVAHKRKVLVDDSTVLHGDTIRQQLTNTEDIRRVRKKAPCTNLEVWVLQKQFLEDEIFSEPVFTGMYPVLRSSGSDAFDLNKITIIREDRNKGASGEGNSAKPTYNAEAEAVGSLVPSIADISVRPDINEKAEAVGTLVPSIVANDGSQGNLLSAACEKELTAINSSTLPNVVETEENEVMKQISQYDASEEKVGMEFAEVRTPVGDEAVHPIASAVEPVSSIDHVPEVAYNQTDNIKVNSPLLNDSSDVMMVTRDESDQLLERCGAQCSTGDASTVEDVSGLAIPDQGLAVGVSDKVDLDERSGGEHLSEKREGVDTDIVMGQVQDSCSLPVHDSSITDSMAFEDRALPSSDHVLENCHLDEHEVANKDESSFAGFRHDGNCLISNNVDEHVKLGSPCPVEADLSSRITNLDEKEGQQHWEADLMIAMDSTRVPTEFIDNGNNAEFGTDSIQHDTDFLNVDDDDVAEDYESDVPDDEEKRILDNSGWSARTRAVANYLQGLFERESVQAKKSISLDSLLVGKSRKEASRMFFETLVLKTKDYVQAEQECSFSDIKIKPRGKLLK